MENATESMNESPVQEASPAMQARSAGQIRTYSVSGLGAALDNFVDSDEKPAESAIRELKPKIVGMLQDGYAIADVILALQQGGMDDVGRRQIAKYLAAAGISKELKQDLQSRPKRRTSRRNAPAEAMEGPEAAAGMPADAPSDAAEVRMDGTAEESGGRRSAGGEPDKMAAYNALKSLRGE